MFNEKITAVIPVRKGSQRVKNKNLCPFAGTSLLDVKIKTLLQVPELDSVVVNTDSLAAIEFVENMYADTIVTCHRRDDYYASSSCSGSEFFKHLGEVTDTDVFVYTPCTSPLIRPSTISSCIRKFLEKNGDFDCVSTVSSIKDFLWLNGKAVNYDPSNAPNSQDLPDILALNFGATVIRRGDLIKNRNIIGKNPFFMITNDIEAIDIDTPLDFFIAEQLYIKTQIEKFDLFV